jgi:hypothetical protein
MRFGIGPYDSADGGGVFFCLKEVIPKGFHEKLKPE